MEPAKIGRWQNRGDDTAATRYVLVVEEDGGHVVVYGPFASADEAQLDAKRHVGEDDPYAVALLERP